MKISKILTQNSRKSFLLPNLASPVSQSRRSVHQRLLPYLVVQKTVDEVVATDLTFRIAF